MGGDLCKNNRSDGLTAQNKNSKNVEGASCKKNQNDGLAAQNVLLPDPLPGFLAHVSWIPVFSGFVFQTSVLFSKASIKGSLCHFAQESLVAGFSCIISFWAQLCAIVYSDMANDVTIGFSGHNSSTFTSQDFNFFKHGLELHFCGHPHWIWWEKESRESLPPLSLSRPASLQEKSRFLTGVQNPPMCRPWRR